MRAFVRDYPIVLLPPVVLAIITMAIGFDTGWSIQLIWDYVIAIGGMLIGLLVAVAVSSVLRWLFG